MKDSKINNDRYQGIIQEGPECVIPNIKISSISDYFEAVKSLPNENDVYWFRGQENVTWDLTPGALRDPKEKTRTEALEKLNDFKRYAPTKITRKPNNELEWVQLARHFGLPTRLLDWTQNSAIGLYFACQESGKDGLVFLFDPVDLNTRTVQKNPRIFDANEDQDIIGEYLELKGRIREDGNFKTIAINPVWNSERILRQQGTFTLHGNRSLKLTQNEVNSLVALPILKEKKNNLLKDLEMIGIDEMTIFPEPEHVASYLKDTLDLNFEGGG